jgi:hypothetical protein
MPAVVVRNILLTSGRAPHPSSDVCAACGSWNIDAVEWHGPTGVVAPDGGEEYRLQLGYKCRECGAIEDL